MPLTTYPDFPVITVATLVGEIGDTSFKDLALARLTQLSNEGKTQPPRFVDRIDGRPVTIYRHWLNTDAANEWISFIQSFNDPNVAEIKIYT
jgi:hypothetical protein